RFEVEAAGFEKRSHLLPGLEHFAAVNSLNDRTFKNHIVNQIKCDRLAGNTEKRGAAALAQHLKPLANACRIAAHFEKHVYAVAVGGFADARDRIAFFGSNTASAP